MGRRRLACAVAVVLAFSVAFAGARIGRPAPELAGETIAHRDISLAQLKGKVVVVQFWASWCASCVDGLPRLQKLYDRYAGDGLEILSVSLDEDPRALRRMVAEREIGWQQLCDGRGFASPLARRWDVNSIPRYFVIDREGKLAAKNVRPSKLAETVNQALAPAGAASEGAP